MSCQKRKRVRAHNFCGQVRTSGTSVGCVGQTGLIMEVLMGIQQTTSPEIPVVPQPQPEIAPYDVPQPEIPPPPDPSIPPGPEGPEIVPEHSPPEVPPLPPEHTGNS
jgi:hypothetical protein